MVDDVDQLDTSSALLVGALVNSRICPVLMTMRDSARLPDPVERQWASGRVQLLELGPLGRDEIGRACALALGAPLDAGLRSGWPTRAPETCCISGRFSTAAFGMDRWCSMGERWNWRGPLKLTSQLADLLSERMVGAPNDVTLRASLVSAWPIRFRSTPSSSCAVGRRSRRPKPSGSVTVQQDRHRLHVSLSHPLYGEVLRTGCGEVEFAAPRQRYRGRHRQPRAATTRRHAASGGARVALRPVRRAVSVRRRGIRSAKSRERRPGGRSGPGCARRRRRPCSGAGTPRVPLLAGAYHRGPRDRRLDHGDRSGPRGPGSHGVHHRVTPLLRRRLFVRRVRGTRRRRAASRQ